ncbi:MAG: HAMP domain-containing protein [Ardenticatenaceae bacterium]|nr:HAMP domain-containing protein [Ardenticatenaceae bacterium]
MVNTLNSNNYAQRISRTPWRLFAIGVVAALTVVAILMVALMRAPLQEITTLMYWLSISSLLSLVVGYILYRRGLTRSPSLTLTLVLTYGWAAIVILVNVWIMSERMFLNDEHDLILSGVLLLFAAIIATTFGIFVAASVTDGLRLLARTAQQIAEGHLEARVPISGRDEVAMVGQTFNQMATQLQQAAQEREELEQMRKDLIAWTSHDLRTPLTSIRAMIEALHDGVVDDPATVRRYYSTIRSDIIAFNDIIDDLFELAQLDAGGLTLDMARHALADLVSDTLESFEVIAQDQEISLRGEVAQDLGLVWMCAPKIGRVLSNLVSNALRYTPAGGTVQVTAVRHPNEVVVTVQDSGSGFAPEDLGRVFEQFYRGEQARSRTSGSGAGLGLAIAQGIVTAHNGRIWAENAPEGGAIVGFSLPN